MRRTFALLLAAVMAAGTLTGPAMAAESQKEGTADSASQEVQEETTLPPDPEGTVTWANLDSRIRSGSLSARVLSENISGIEGIDYDLMYEDLRRQLNDIANAQWYITMMGGDDSSLANAYDSLRDTFDDLKDGEVQADNADVVWQLDSMDYIRAEGKYPVVIKADGLALGKGVLICENEQQAADGQRSLAALDRSLEELHLRQQLGQVSKQTVDEVEAQRTQVVSQLSALDTTITTYKSQLQTLIGEEPTGEITLGALPAKGEDGWTAPDYEADLAAAKAASWTLRSAQKALEDAEEDWKDARSDYRSSRKQYLLQQAEHTWNAAQLTYQSTVQNFETSFKSLYDSLANYEQLYASAQSALVWQQSQLDTVQTRYDLGLTTCSAVLDAQDEVASAQSALDSAWRDLFSACNSYRWAVEYGLLPAQGA
mgnify:CR=1 FL=1